MLRNSLINFTLKLGLAFALVYAGLASIAVPDQVLSFWPSFLSSHLNQSFLIFLSGIGCFSLVGWIFSNKMQFTSAVTTSAIFALTGIFNITDVPFLVGLAPLFFISTALALRYYPRVRVIGQTKVTTLANITFHNTENGNKPEGQTVESVVESGTHEEHDQHIFIPKQ